MVKAYLRYESAGAFGVVSSGPAPCYDASGRLLVTAALENLTVWNVKQGSLVRTPLVQDWLVVGTCIRVHKQEASVLHAALVKKHAPTPGLVCVGGHACARARRQWRHLHQQLPHSRSRGDMHHTCPWRQLPDRGRVLRRLGECAGAGHAQGGAACRAGQQPWLLSDACLGETSGTVVIVLTHACMQEVQSMGDRLMLRSGQAITCCAYFCCHVKF